jgi:hypothetical protein
MSKLFEVPEYLLTGFGLILPNATGHSQAAIDIQQG